MQEDGFLLQDTQGNARVIYQEQNLWIQIPEFTPCHHFKAGRRKMEPIHFQILLFPYLYYPSEAPYYLPIISDQLEM